MVLHIAEHELWQRALDAGEPYVPSSFVADGFVHCSTAAQIRATLATWYQGRDDVVVLTIDDTAAGPAVVMEPGSLGEAELYPHLYAPVELSWVSRVDSAANHR